MNHRNWILNTVLCFFLAACGGHGGDAQTPTPAPATNEPTKEEAHADIVKLSAQQIAAANIELAVAGPFAIRETVALHGAVAPNGERVRDIKARFPGSIRSVNGKIGDSVREGTVLATVESNESLETYRIVAPISGVITARNANPGEQTADRELFTVSDLSTVWVELNLFPRDVARIQRGQSVRVSTSDGSLTADSKLSYIAPVSSAANQTVVARAVMENPERRWAPGLYVKAEVTLGEQQAKVAVRNTALHSFEGETVVFEKTGEGFVARPVRTGRSDSEYSEILEGLSAGASYATRNSYVIKAEMGKGEAGHDD